MAHIHGEAFLFVNGNGVRDHADGDVKVGVVLCADTVAASRDFRGAVAVKDASIEVHRQGRLLSGTNRQFRWNILRRFE